MSFYVKPSELLATPDTWTQNAYAENACGIAVDARGPNACRWCIEGALAKCFDVVEIRTIEEYHKLLKHVRETTGFMSIAHWNDYPQRTHAEVLELLKEVGL